MYIYSIYIYMYLHLCTCLCMYLYACGTRFLKQERINFAPAQQVFLFETSHLAIPAGWKKPQAALSTNQKFLTSNQ